MPFSFGDGKPQPQSPPSPHQSLSMQQQPQLNRPPSLLPSSPPHVPVPNGNIQTQLNASGITDRAELIERIKAGETPTWIPTRNLSDRYYPNHTPTSSPRLTDDHPDRPQSALHQGIFTSEGRAGGGGGGGGGVGGGGGGGEGGRGRGSHMVPRSPTDGPTPFGSYGFALRLPPAPLQTSPPRHHARTPSVSCSFVLKTPTSPLVHSSNPDTDGSSDESARPPSTEPIDIGFSERRARRKSLPPSALSTLQLSPIPAAAAAFGSIPAHRLWNEHVAPTPSSSSRHARRPSGFGPSSSPSSSELPFGSFVGSYEESILSGRMSTTPSKPLSFLAQIGVLGLGKCKQSLRCPTHVTLPFPAYFYSVGDYDSPSPYVGQIDLDSALGSQSAKGKKAPPGVGGSYRIPQRGQLQIVIKNPNKTAVKLFLVPYDLRDMEPGTRTFIRQKAYSAGEAPATTTTDTMSLLTRPKEKDSLRYLIHLQMVCPSRGRYYIFKSIRVVFANRVPDGKERLRNESHGPDPKYSVWKPESSGSATTTATAVPTQGRQRSASLYGMSRQVGAGGGGGGTTAGGVGRIGLPPPMPLLMQPPPVPPPPPPPRPDSDGAPVSMDTDDGAYEKVDLSGLRKVEGHGLLARRLKQLEMEAQHRQMQAGGL